MEHPTKMSINCLALSLHLAKENMNIWTWEHCCTVALKINQPRTHTCHTCTHHLQVIPQFPKHRKFQLRVNSKDLPPFLHANPDICMNIQRYGKENLDTLSIEMLLEYIHDKVLPALAHLTFNELFSCRILPKR